MSLTQINKAGLDEIALDHVFTIGASGSSAYTFQGEGLNGTVNNPTLYLTRGKTYRFENGSGGHPIRIQSTSGASGTAYNTGVTNNAGSGTVIVEVQHDAPDVLYYQCTSHAAMNGILYITGALADGGVTTAKIADDAVTTAKIATDAVTGDGLASTSVNTTHLVDTSVTTSKIADSQITTAKINDSAVTTAKIANQAVNADKIANGGINTAKLADQSVTLAKLVHGTSSNNGKFLRANNGADPTFETVNTDLVSDTSPQLGGYLDTNGHNIQMLDNDKLRLGTSFDLEIYHDGSNSRIADNGTGYLIHTSNGDGVLIQAASGQNLAKFYTGGAVELYHNYNKKFETASHGISALGDVYFDNQVNAGKDIYWDESNDRMSWSDNVHATFGNGEDLRIYHDGNDSYIDDAGTGSLLIRTTTSSNVSIKSTNAFMARFQTGSAAELYYNGDRRIFTSPGGLQIDNAGSNPIITNTNSPVYANAGLELHRGGTGYCDVRFASNYGVTMSLAGISNSSTTEFSFIQDNSGNAYVRNEHTNPINFQIGGGGSGNLVMKMQNGGEVTIPRQPCFSGSTNMGSGNGSANANVILKHGVNPSNRFSDIGNCYNTSNGRFTCPVAGNYMVSVSMLAQGQKYLYFKLNGNDIGNGSVAYTGQSDYSMVSSCMILTASANDYIEINARGSGQHYQNEHGSAFFALIS